MILKYLKRFKPLYFSVAVLIACTGCGQEISIPHPVIAMPGEAIDVDVYMDQASLDTSNDSESVYRMIVPSNSDIEAQIGSVVSIESANDTWVAGDDTYYSFDDGKMVTVNSNIGFWSYTTEYEFSDDICLPVDAAVIEIAKEYILENKLMDSVDSNEMVINYTTTGDSLEGTERIIEKTATYFPSINGVPVYGLYRISITVGNQGEITGVLKQANPVEYVSSVPVKNEAAILEAVTNKEYSLNASANSGGEDLVASAGYAAYYCDAYSDYMLPVYVIIGGETDNDESPTFDLIMDYQLNDE